MDQPTYKRKTIRTKVSFPILLKKAELQSSSAPDAFGFQYLAKDISYKGMRIETRMPLSKGDILEIEFALSKVARILTLKVEVLSNTKGGPGKVQTVGCKFVDISEKDQQYLKVILDLYR